jgi:sulfur transfer complex TusBCD TusB component (DsrH family)
MAKEMFEALHPDPNKQGTRVTKATYEAYKTALLNVIPHSKEGVAFMALRDAVVPHLPEDILNTSSTGWWCTVVKLDLEARGIVERVPGRGPQHVRRV